MKEKMRMLMLLGSLGLSFLGVGAAVAHAEVTKHAIPYTWDKESRSVYDLLVAQMQSAETNYRGSVDTLVRFAKSQHDEKLYAEAFRSLLEVERYNDAMMLVEEWQTHSKTPLDTYVILAQTLNNKIDLAVKTVNAQIKRSRNADAIISDTLRILMRYWYRDSVTQVVARLHEKYPRDTLLSLTLARQLRWAGKTDEAVELIDALLFDEPQNINYWQEKSDCYRYELRMQEAEAVWTEALRDYPNDERIRFAYAEFLSGQYDFDAADRVLAQIPLDTTSHANVSDTFANDFVRWSRMNIKAKLGDFKAAENVYDWETLDAGLQDKAYYALAEIALQKQELALSQEYLKKIGDDGALAVPAALKRARIGYQTSRQEGDTLIAEIVERYQLTSPEEIREKANAMHEAGLEEGAYDLLSKYLDKNPNDDDSRYLRGLFAAEMGREKRAREDLTILYNRSPYNADYQNALGYTLLSNTKDYEAAEEMIKKALSVEPSSVPIIDSMGWLLYRQGEYDKALPFFRYAYAHYSDGEIIGHYIALLEKVGQQELSKKLYNVEKKNQSNVDAIDIYRK